MKTKIEIGDYCIEVCEKDGFIEVKAEKDDEVVEEFTIELTEGDQEEGQSQEEGDDVQGFDDFEKEDDFDEEGQAQGDEDDDEDDEAQELPALESFDSFSKRKK
jgi:DNA-binding PadR family transcriptional regulator